MKYFLFFASFIFSFFLLYGAFFIGYKTADREVVYIFKDAPVLATMQIKQVGDVAGAFIILPTPTPEPTEISINEEVGKTSIVSGNNSLFAEINLYRTSRGLSPFTKDDRLCGWVGERLGQLVGRGNLDNHEGFQSQLNNFLGNGYTHLAENTGQGFQSTSELVGMWEHSLAHRATLESTEYSVGCADTRNSFGVLIAGSQ